MEPEKESYLAEKGESNPLFKMSKLFGQVILLLGQPTNSCSYIRRFNVLMSFVGDKKKVHAQKQCYSILGCWEHVIWV